MIKVNDGCLLIAVYFSKVVYREVQAKTKEEALDKYNNGYGRDIGTHHFGVVGSVVDHNIVSLEDNDEVEKLTNSCQSEQ